MPLQPFLFSNWLYFIIMYGFGIKFSYNNSFFMPILIYFGFYTYFLHSDSNKKAYRTVPISF
ncbi:hypothetical protein BOH71_20940 [Bacillus subtilis]|nr:hypothetical protein BOH71_20940 [Bacillus subtilis]